jgi:hypothetical protein
MAGSFNNFHGRLKQWFHVLSDDKLGSTPRFKPGSLATKDVDVVEINDDAMDDRGTPGTPKSVKRKASEGADDKTGSTSKLRPRR